MSDADKKRGIAESIRALNRVFEDTAAVIALRDVAAVFRQGRPLQSEEYAAMIARVRRAGISAQQAINR